MSGLSKRRVYVMDCGNVVKIGVSGNVELRKNQIPFKVRQYYCTEPIKNAFEIEKMLHKKFSTFKAQNVNGNEYFNISFKCASDALRKCTDADFAATIDAENREKHIADIVKTLSQLDSESLLLISAGARLLAARQDMDKEIADQSRQLQEA